MFPGLHVSVENTANAECTFFFFFLLFYRGKSVQPIFIFNTRARRIYHGGRAKTHGFCLKFTREEGRGGMMRVA